MEISDVPFSCLECYAVGGNGVLVHNINGAPADAPNYIRGLVSMIQEAMAQGDSLAAVGDLEDAALLYRQVLELG